MSVCRVFMASVRGGQNSTIRTVGRGLGMPVVHLSVGMDSLCSLCICEHKKTRLVVHKKPGHARVTLLGLLYMT